MLDEIVSAVIDEDGAIVRKSVFLIIYTGGGTNIIKNKLNRACNAFNATIYMIPTN
jgi:hypothetical protein